MARWYALVGDEGAESDPFEAGSDEEAIAEARQRVGEWIDPTEISDTAWVVERLVEVVGDERREVGEVARRIEPEAATTCPNGEEHEWVDDGTLYRLVGGLRDNPGVWGHGGGVTITEVCRRCGTEVVRDTWCQCGDYPSPGAEHVHRYVTVGKYREELEEV
jgi:hypothetical protein